MTTIRARNFYAITSLPAGSRLAPEDSLSVHAFSSRDLRDSWVDYEWDPDTSTEDSARYGGQVLMTIGEERYSAPRDEALSAARKLMPGISALDLSTILPVDDAIGRG